MSDVKALHAVPLHDVSEGEADVLCPTCGTLVHVTKLRDEKYPDDAYTLEYTPIEAECTKHAALVEAAKAVDDYVSGHFSRDKVQYIDCPPCREKLLALRAVLADLEASDD